jgi:hypothetical protein
MPCLVSALPPMPANPNPPGWCPTSKNWDSWLYIVAFQASFMMGRLLLCSGTGPGKKIPVFFVFFIYLKFWLFSGFFFFNFFPTYLYSKQSHINWLFTYVSMYLIYVEGDPQCRGILFCGKHPQQPCAVCGEGGPTIAAHPRCFLMPWIEPRCQGKLGKSDSRGCHTREPAQSTWGTSRCPEPS